MIREPKKEKEGLGERGRKRDVIAPKKRIICQTGLNELMRTSHAKLKRCLLLNEVFSLPYFHRTFA